MISACSAHGKEAQTISAATPHGMQHRNSKDHKKNKIRKNMQKYMNMNTR
jgi:hypothetical protein